VFEDENTVRPRPPNTIKPTCISCSARYRTLTYHNHSYQVPPACCSARITCLYHNTLLPPFHRTRRSVVPKPVRHDRPTPKAKEAQRARSLEGRLESGSPKGNQAQVSGSRRGSTDSLDEKSQSIITQPQVSSTIFFRTISDIHPSGPPRGTFTFTCTLDETTMLCHAFVTNSP